MGGMLMASRGRGRNRIKDAQVPHGRLYGSNPRWQRADQYPEVGTSSGNQTLTRCAFVVTKSEGRTDNFRVPRHSGVIRPPDVTYALDAKAAMFRRARRLLPALAAILIPASVLSKKSAMLSRFASELISPCFFALV